MAETTRKITDVVERATATAGGVSRRTLAWGGVALAAVMLLSVNLIAANSLREARFDLTEENLFTISEGTRKALRAIDEPIDIRVYFSKKLGEASPTYAKNFERVRTMLDQYRDIARGKLKVTYFDPEPFSVAEDRAVAAGLKGVRLNQEGDLGYFGIVGSNSTDTEANLPFLAADRERFLEYDVTKLIVTLAHQGKTAVGLISGIPLEGSPGNPMMRRPPTRAPVMLDQIREFFEVKSIAKDAKEIPDDIGVLMVVQPEGLAPETAYAIDQFALSGGKVLAFVDPVAEMSKQGNPMFMMAKGAPDFAEFDKLLKAWGVAFDATKLAGDIERARRVQFGSGLRPTVTDYILWLSLNRGNFNQKDVLVADVKQLNFATAGVLTKAAGATTQFAPIVRTTGAGMQVAADKVRMMPDAVGLLRDYKPGGTPLVLAARVSGEAKSAFPDGPPAPEAKADESDAAKDKASDKSAGKAGDAAKAAGKESEATAKAAEDKAAEDKAAEEEAKAEAADVAKDKASDKSAESASDAPAAKAADEEGEATAKAAEEKEAKAEAADAAKDKASDNSAENAAKAADKEAKAAGQKKAKAAPKTEAKDAGAEPAKAHVAAGKVNVIVVADTDFLHDQFWLDVRELLGQQVAIPIAHNGTFVLAALENLTGSDALISLRARGVADRPFELVNDLRREAEQRFRRSEQVLTARLEELQTKLADLKKRSDGEAIFLSDEDRQEIEKFQNDYLQVRRELRAVKHELRKDIDRLDGVLKFVNIAAVPLLIGVVGIGWAYRRRRRSTSQPQAAETQQ